MPAVLLRGPRVRDRFDPLDGCDPPVRVPGPAPATTTISTAAPGRGRSATPPTATRASTISARAT